MLAEVGILPFCRIFVLLNNSIYENHIYIYRLICIISFCFISCKEQRKDKYTPNAISYDSISVSRYISFG